MSGQSKQRLPCCWIPKFHHAVFTGSGKLFSIRAECQSIYITGVTKQFKQKLTGRGIPYLYGGIKITCCNASSIRAGGNSRHIGPASGFAGSESLFTSGGVPGGNRESIAACIQYLSIGAKHNIQGKGLV